MLILTLLACGDISNELFAEDALFLDAFPAEERTEVDPDESASSDRRADDTPLLFQMLVNTATTVNGTIKGILTIVDTVRTYPPSERTEDGRSWGPWAMEDAGGVDLSVWMNRSGQTRYDWGFDGNGTTFLSGTHYAGETVATGDGAFVWDQTQLSEWNGDDFTGVFEVDYDNRAGVDVIMHGEDVQSGDDARAYLDYAWKRTGDEGDFQFRTPVDLEDGSGELADMELRARWVVGEGGRGDAVVSGGAYGDTVLHWSQCWNSAHTLVYQWDDLGITEPVGDAGDCPYTEFAYVDRI